MKWIIARLLVYMSATLTLTKLVLGEVCQSRSSYYKLRASLFKGYSPDIRPVRNVSVVTHVTLHVHIKSLADVDVKLQTMNQVVYMDITWKDEFITWNPADYDGVQNFLVRQKEIWTPDLMFGPHMSGQSLNLGHDDMLLMVWYDGRVSWTPDLTIETSCSMDITNYPFDEQRCSWRLYPWMSDDQHITLEVRNLSDIFDMLVSENVEWSLIGVGWQTCDFKSAYFRFSCVSFTYKLKRRPTFLVLTLVVPTVMLAIMSTLVFALPLESGEKVSLSVTPVLAVVLLLSIMMKVLPQSSLQTSIFVKYLVVLVVCSTFSVVLTVLNLSIYRRPDCMQVPPLAVRFVHLFHRSCSQLAGRKCALPLSRMFGKKATQNGMEGNGGCVDVTKTNADTTYVFKPTCNGGPAGEERKHSMVSSDTTSTSAELGIRDRPMSFHSTVKCCWRHDAEVTWRDVASACDYVFFRLFMLTVVSSTLICFVTMWTGVWNLNRD